MQRINRHDENPLGMTTGVRSERRVPLGRASPVGAGDASPCAVTYEVEPRGLATTRANSQVRFDPQSRNGAGLTSGVEHTVARPPWEPQQANTLPSPATCSLTASTFACAVPRRLSASPAFARPQL